MSFSITNTSESAVITSVTTPSSKTGELTITSGSFPLFAGDFVDGTNTTIDNGGGFPGGTIQVFLQQGDAKIDTYFNGTLYSSDKYSSGIAPILTPIIQSGDSFNVAISDPDFSCYDFGTGFNFEPLRVVELSDGKFILVGAFTTYQGVSANRIIKLNADMSRDTTFNIGTGFNNTCYWITEQPDGKLLVGGAFTSYNGLAHNRIIRLNSDGTHDSTFGIAGGFNGPVYTIAVQSNGKILVGGGFTTYRGQSHPYLIRLNANGTIDNTFPSLSFDAVIYEIALQPDGKILPVGDFTSVSGVSRNGIVRLNTNGTIDTSFDADLGGDVPSGVAIKVQSDGKIILGGIFNTVSGVSSNLITRLNSNGTRDASFNVGSGFTGGGFPFVVDVFLTGDKYLVSGFFNDYNGESVAYLARLNSDGSFDTTLNQGSGFVAVPDPYDPVVFPLSNGNIMMCGMTGYDGVAVPKIAILNPYGTLLNCQ